MSHMPPTSAPSRATTYGAVVFRGVNNLRFQQRTATEVGEHEVGIRVAYAGICGSDLSIISGEWPGAWQVGRTMGHEASGVVEAVGSHVTDIEVGTAVTWEPMGPCGVCRQCRDGQVGLCAAPNPHEGAWAESVVIPRSAVHVLPVGLDLRLGALAEPLSCSLEAYEQAGLRLDDTVVIIGAGTLGLMLAALAAKGGARSIVVVTRSEAKSRVARRLGATDTVLSSANPDETRAAVVSVLGGTPDVVFEATGVASSYELALSLPARGGRVVAVGAGHAADQAVVNPHDLYRRTIAVTSSRNQNFKMRRAVGLLDRLPLEHLITDTVALHDFETGLAQARTSGGIKVLLDVCGGASDSLGGPTQRGHG